MGEVDAVLVSSSHGDQGFTLQGAEHPYRLLVETIEEGAATLSDDGTVLYSNKSFAAFFGVPLEKFIGTPLYNFVSGNDAEFLKTLILGAKLASTRGEIRLLRGSGKPGARGVMWGRNAGRCPTCGPRRCWMSAGWRRQCTGTRRVFRNEAALSWKWLSTPTFHASPSTRRQRCFALCRKA